MSKKILEFILIFIMWSAFVWSFEIPDLMAGGVVAFLVVAMFSDIFPKEISRILHPVRFFLAAAFSACFYLARHQIKYRCHLSGLSS